MYEIAKEIQCTKLLVSHHVAQKTQVLYMPIAQKTSAQYAANSAENQVLNEPIAQETSAQWANIQKSLNKTRSVTCVLSILLLKPVISSF